MPGNQFLLHSFQAFPSISFFVLPHLKLIIKKTSHWFHSTIYANVSNSLGILQMNNISAVHKCVYLYVCLSVIVNESVEKQNIQWNYWSEFHCYSRKCALFHSIGYHCAKTQTTYYVFFSSFTRANKMIFCSNVCVCACECAGARVKKQFPITVPTVFVCDDLLHFFVRFGVNVRILYTMFRNRKRATSQIKFFPADFIVRYEYAQNKNGKIVLLERDRINPIF